MWTTLARLLLPACLATGLAAQKETPAQLEEGPPALQKAATLRRNTPVLQQSSRIMAPIDRATEYKRRRAVFEGARMRSFPGSAAPGNERRRATEPAPEDPLRWLKWLLTVILLGTSALSAKAWLEGRRDHELASEHEQRQGSPGTAERQPRLHPDEAPDLTRGGHRAAQQSL